MSMMPESATRISGGIMLHDSTKPESPKRFSENIVLQEAARLERRAARRGGFRDMTFSDLFHAPANGRNAASVDCDRQRDLPDPDGDNTDCSIRIPEG